mmetsp:Transcript_15377/g.20374  ORF Transcript_15377/g.20374 Transcript_15377/m.20374 type:complete len:234 (+) Transcript_15377:423-1124(+)
MSRTFGPTLNPSLVQYLFKHLQVVLIGLRLVTVFLEMKMMLLRTQFLILKTQLFQIHKKIVVLECMNHMLNINCVNVLNATRAYIQLISAFDVMICVVLAKILMVIVVVLSVLKSVTIIRIGVHRLGLILLCLPMTLKKMLHVLILRTLPVLLAAATILKILLIKIQNHIVMFLTKLVLMFQKSSILKHGSHANGTIIKKLVKQMALSGIMLLSMTFLMVWNILCVHKLNFHV